jgi:hypothetical protein
LERKLKVKKMKKNRLFYEVEIEAEDIDKAEELAEANEGELKKKARLKIIKGENECWEKFYETE